MIKIYSIEKYKNKTLKLLMGVLIGTTLTGCSNNISNPTSQVTQEVQEIEETEEADDIAIYEMDIEEKLKTRGELIIYFKNTEYIDEINEYVNAKVDTIAFYDEEGNGYGVVTSNKDTYTTTFQPGDYKFYSKYLNLEGEFTITSPGEQLTLNIDYQKMTYDINNVNSNTNIR